MSGWREYQNAPQQEEEALRRDADEETFLRAGSREPELQWRIHQATARQKPHCASVGAAQEGFLRDSSGRRRGSGQGVGKWGKFGSDFGRGGFGFARQRSEPGWNLDLFDCKRGRREAANRAAGLISGGAAGFTLACASCRSLSATSGKGTDGFGAARGTEAGDWAAGVSVKEKGSQLFLKAAVCCFN